MMELWGHVHNHPHKRSLYEKQACQLSVAELLQLVAACEFPGFAVLSACGEVIMAIYLPAALGCCN